MRLILSSLLTASSLVLLVTRSDCHVLQPGKETDSKNEGLHLSSPSTSLEVALSLSASSKIQSLTVNPLSPPLHLNTAPPMPSPTAATLRPRYSVPLNPIYYRPTLPTPSAQPPRIFPPQRPNAQSYRRITWVVDKITPHLSHQSTADPARFIFPIHSHLFFHATLNSPSLRLDIVDNYDRNPASGHLIAIRALAFKYLPENSSPLSYSEDPNITRQLFALPPIASITNDQIISLSSREDVNLPGRGLAFDVWSTMQRLVLEDPRWSRDERSLQTSTCFSLAVLHHHLLYGPDLYDILTQSNDLSALIAESVEWTRSIYGDRALRPIEAIFFEHESAERGMTPRIWRDYFSLNPHQPQQVPLEQDMGWVETPMNFPDEFQILAPEQRFGDGSFPRVHPFALSPRSDYTSTVTRPSHFDRRQLFKKQATSRRCSNSTESSKDHSQ